MPLLADVKSSIRPAAATLHRRLLSVLAKDETDTTATRSALVFAPHPDDETIGCGATIARKTEAGTRVDVVIVADGGSSIRRAECVEACRRLGVRADRVAFLGFTDGGLSRELPRVVEQISSAWSTIEPDEVYAPCLIDAHDDHRALARAVEQVRADEHPADDVLSYPVWFWNRWAWTTATRSRSAQRLDLLTRPVRFTVTTRARTVATAGHLAVKRAALAAHVTQVEGSNTEIGGLDPEWLQLFFGRDEVFFVQGSR
jgi:LmbE family N-acetylglucosaminyl deacetylase